MSGVYHLHSLPKRMAKAVEKARRIEREYFHNNPKETVFERNPIPYETGERFCMAGDTVRVFLVKFPEDTETRVMRAFYWKNGAPQAEGN